MVIYKVDTFMNNPKRHHTDLHCDYDTAIGFYNGVKNNPDCESIEVIKLENEIGESLLREVEIVASCS